MLRIALLALTLMLPTLIHAQSGDEVTQFSNGDQGMNAAMDKAQTTLPIFLRNVTDAEGYGMPNTSVKVAFPTPNGAEIIWVRPFAWDSGTGMVGRLANQPNFMGDLNAGDIVEFDISMVRDWSLTQEDGTMWGNYTTRVMLPELDAATATDLNARLSPTPVPSDWN